MENSSSHIGEYPWGLDQIGTPEYHLGPEENDPEDDPSCHCINCLYAYGLPDYPQ
jgi:hypothetical protein